MNLGGWVDGDAHMRFQGSEDIRRNRPHLMGIKEMKYTEGFHVRLHAA